MAAREGARADAGAAWILAGVFAVALAFRLAAVWQLGRSGLWDYLRLDPLYYHDWALRIARGELVGRQTYEMTPLYAYALGGVFALFGEGLLLPRLLQALLGAGTCTIVAHLGQKIFGRAEGLLAGLALAAYGPSLFHETQIMKTVLTVALSTAAAAAVCLSEGRRPARLAAGGALLGLTALCQENVNVALPVLAVWAAWRAPRGGRLACAGALAAGWALAVAPVAARNLAVSGDFVLITTGGGEVFYTGNNEHASGRYRPPAFVRPDPFFEHEDFRAEAARRLARPVTRKESDAFWWGEGWRFIAADPWRWLLLLWDKLTVYFTDYERPDNYSYGNFRLFLPVLSLPLARFGWIAPPGLVGLALSARRWAELIPLHATMGVYLLSALVFFTQDRYRMPMVPLLALFAAHGVVTLGRAALRRDARGLAWGLPAVGLLALAVNRDAGQSLAFRAQNEGILGEMYLQSGRPAEAAARFRETLRLLEGYPGDSTGDQHRRVVASAHFGLAIALETAGAAAPAGEVLAHLRAAGASPDADLRRDALGRAGALLLSGGDAAAATEAYRSAAEAAPADLALRLRFAEALHRGGRPREALEEVESALREAPPADPRLLASAHFGRALLYRDLGDPAAMRRHLAEALRLDPAHPRADWMRHALSSAGEEPSP